ncbi:unnamed protein product [Ambrosiozyma monospora]|uniref:Unnamed protein product n=1 Tax=Ambrosiozyma monospora TaxID=43982 RepID=A0ACB5SSL6_AMBMO|nr:unnamed protein product [Ambrosiozyma monospora]
MMMKFKTAVLEESSGKPIQRQSSQSRPAKEIDGTVVHRISSDSLKMFTCQVQTTNKYGTASTTTSTPFEMINWKSGDGSFYVNYISATSTTTDSNGSESTTVFMTTTTGLDRYGSSLALPTSICENCDSESWGVTQVALTDGSTAGGALDPMAN